MIRDPLARARPLALFALSAAAIGCAGNVDGADASRAAAGNRGSFGGGVHLLPTLPGTMTVQLNQSEPVDPAGRLCAMATLTPPPNSFLGYYGVRVEWSLD